MKILGINSFFEHPAVALSIDGQLVFALEDERITRIKHGKSYTPYKTYLPIDSIYAALKFADLKLSDIDEIAYSYDRWKHLASLWGCFTGHRLSSFHEEMTAFRAVSNVQRALASGYEIPRRYRDRITPSDFKKIKFRAWDHHLSHAASAFFCSGFDKSLVFVADGSGENACTSVYVGEGKDLKKIRQISLPHSLGFFYSFITEHLGFEPFSDEYKVMGLAAYGEDSFARQMAEILPISEDGGYRLDRAKLSNLAPLLGPARKASDPMTQQHKDIAKSTQIRLEQAVEALVLAAIKETGISKICVAGGTFLNILVNARLAALPQVSEMFVQPAAHDAGTAIGAVALSNIHHGGAAQLSYPSMFLGTEPSDAEIEKYLKVSNVSYTVLQDAPAEIADLLHKENIIALYRSRMEFGPRALGNRSLLASPISEKTRTKLNELKVREQFRPLAPLVMSEKFDDYFIGEKNRYMMFTVNVKDDVKAKIPAVTHADGTARAQVIYKEHDPYLYELLAQFEKLQGLPILINTSLNVRGKPIDESPYDAMASFYTSGVDYLVMGKYLIEHPSKMVAAEKTPAKKNAA
jgi:carbamoyltransferase